MFDSTLFSSEENQEGLTLPLPNAKITYYPQFMETTYASEVFEKLLKETAWQQDDIKIFGKVYKQPRLTALYGDEGKSYSYSSITMYPKPLTSLLKEIKAKIESITETTFNTVLLNLYRDGNDSNGWHSDDEKELGKNPVIASVSLGAKRGFKLKHKGDKKFNYKIFLNHGSLIIKQG